MAQPSVYRRLRTTAGALLPTDKRTQVGRWERALRARRATDLDALALHYGTDKSTAGHAYTPIYQRLLGARRRQVTSVLEIGVGGTSSWHGYETLAGGHSLRMWRDYFPNARIVGIDLHAKGVAAPRISFEQGDQADPNFLKHIADVYGPFDLVIDDGSHIGRHIRASFEVLWDAVTPGGFYVIEDLEVAYDPEWEGGPPGTPGTAVELLKELVDSTVARHGGSYKPPISAMHLHANIAFIKRAAPTD